MNGLKYPNILKSLSTKDLLDILDQIEDDCGKQTECDNCPHMVDTKCKLELLNEILKEREQNESKKNIKRTNEIKRTHISKSSK
jgi:hypothetical protein